MSKLDQKLRAKHTILRSIQTKNEATNISYLTAGRIHIMEANVQVIEISKGRMRGRLEFVGSSDTEILRVLKALEGCNTDSHPLYKDRSSIRK